MTSKQLAARQFDVVEADLHELNHWMYEHPEIAFQEYEASQRIPYLLFQHGFEIEYPAYGLDTAFAARVGTDGPEVIICAEYDALPGVGHACGHNIIACAAVGAGIALAPLAGDLGIRLTVLGTPAEEAMSGKVDMIQAGAFSGAAAALMIHPAPDDILDPNVLAVSHLQVDFHGKEAHASAYPQLATNALDAFVQAYVNVSTLRQHLYPTDKVHGIVTHGGDAPNVIPEHTRSLWYVRAATRDRLEEMRAKVYACFEAAATATGCTWDVSLMGHDTFELRTDPLLAELFDRNARSLGRTLGRGVDEPPGKTGSTDMGNVSHVVPSIHPMLSINSDAVNHQYAFAAHTVTPDGQQVIRDGALAMAGTVIDLAAADRWAELGTAPG